MKKIKYMRTVNFYGLILDVYAKSQRDLIENGARFLAVDVAELIDYSKRSNGCYRTDRMIENVDDDEKELCIVKICDVQNMDSTSTARKTQEMWTLTEDGLYEVFFQHQNKKPEIKQWKKEVKKILKDMKDDIVFTGQRRQSAKTHNDLHELIDDEGRSIGLDIALSEIASYRLNLSHISRKEALYQLKKSNIALYDEMMNTAYNCVETFMLLDSECYMGNVIQALKNKFVDDIDKFEEYKKTHKKNEWNIEVKFGR